MNDELKTKLLGFGLSEEQVGKLAAEGVLAESDMPLLSATEIQTAIGGGIVMAKKLVAAFAPAPVTTASPMSALPSLDVLPSVPTDDSWLAALKVGGVLKFNRETVIGTVSAALASRVGLYDLPKTIVEAMERQAQSLDEPVSPEFFEMQRALTERSYAEIFAAIPGATGRYATIGRKNELLGKIDQYLWSSLISFQAQLSGWLDSWQKGASNPAMMMSAIAAMAGGPSMMPPGLMQPPPTEQLRDAAEGVITNINKIFAGTGIPVAMALAYDAQQIRLALESPTLPAQVGAANREQMLRQLGVAVSSDYPRLEANLKRFTLGVIGLPDVTAGQTELSYIVALYQLGAMIPWENLGDRASGLGGGRTATDGRAGIGRGSRAQAL